MVSSLPRLTQVSAVYTWRWIADPHDCPTGTRPCSEVATSADEVSVWQEVEPQSAGQGPVAAAAEEEEKEADEACLMLGLGRFIRRFKVQNGAVAFLRGTGDGRWEANSNDGSSIPARF